MVADFIDDMVPLLTSDGLAEPYSYGFKKQITGKKVEDADKPAIQKEFEYYVDACKVESIIAYLSCINYYTSFSDDGYSVIFTIYAGDVKQVGFTALG